MASWLPPLNGDIKIIFIFGIYFFALLVITLRQPSGLAARHAKDLFGIGIIVGALVMIAVQVSNRISSDAIMGVLGTIAGLYFGTSVRRADGVADDNSKEPKS